MLVWQGSQDEERRVQMQGRVQLGMLPLASSSPPLNLSFPICKMGAIGTYLPGSGRMKYSSSHRTIDL